MSIKQTGIEIAKGSTASVTAFVTFYLPVAKMHLAMVGKRHEEL